jgi:hypothetical protein
MGPKRRKSGGSGQVTRKRRKGILGEAGGYDSEKDEDYAPNAPNPKPTRARKASLYSSRHSATAAAAAAAAVGTTLGGAIRTEQQH